tara:strand:+ start:23 stop:1171 length:1149 start_codon:yes stop_codon:yes gene_type:complete
MDKDLIYLDYAATTPVHPSVIACMQKIQKDSYFNPASNHIAGSISSVWIQKAEEKLLKMLGANQGKLIWTSGATESNNLAILGVAKQRSYRGKHLITMRTEHKAVVDVFRFLEKQGFEVTWLKPESNGKLLHEKLKEAIRPDTQLVSIMHINNEIGAVQDIEEIGFLCRERNIAFHVDGAQAAGKIPVDLSILDIDLYSISGHKFYGPKGIGALYVSDGILMEPIMYGGNQQSKIRPGTLPVDLVAGLGEAAFISHSQIEEDLKHLIALRQQLINGLQEVDGLYINGPTKDGYPGILNVGVSDVNGESLLYLLEPLCVATGSACNSQSQEPSYVLKSIGRSDFEAQSSIRFSFGRFTSPDDIDKAVSIYCKAVKKLRSFSPG